MTAQLRRLGAIALCFLGFKRCMALVCAFLVIGFMNFFFGRECSLALVF